MKKSILDNRIFIAIMNVLSSVILIISIIICAVVIISTKSSTGVANLGGYSFLSVQSDSMEPEFYPGDLIVVKRYAKSHEYQKNDVISFIAYDNTGTMFINTHRVANVIEGEMDYYVTKGDNAEQEDRKHVSASKVLGQYTGKKVSGLGTAFDFAGTSKGVLLLIVLPAAIIVMWQLFSYLRSLALDKRGYAAPSVVASESAVQNYPPASTTDKDVIIKEYLRQQQAEEARKQQIIEEYLTKQKEAEEAQKAKAEEEKIKSIISEFLAQQKASESQNDKNSDNNSQD